MLGMFTNIVKKLNELNYFEEVVFGLFVCSFACLFFHLEGITMHMFGK